MNPVETPAGPPKERHDVRGQNRSVLGLGPLENAIMLTMWANGAKWLTVRDIRARLDYDYDRVAHNTVATVAQILYTKGLLVRDQGRRVSPRNGLPPWFYRAACPMSEYVGGMIAALLECCPDPDSALRCALARR